LGDREERSLPANPGPAPAKAAQHLRLQQHLRAERLSGRTPVEHRNWCYFIHSPETSPFKPLRWLQWLPRALTSRRIVRRLLTKLVKKHLGFEGYFDLYNMPFQHIASYDFTRRAR